jgi:hypothetical protein
MGQYKVRQSQACHAGNERFLPSVACCFAVCEWNFHNHFEFDKMIERLAVIISRNALQIRPDLLATEMSG